MTSTSVSRQFFLAPQAGIKTTVTVSPNAYMTLGTAAASVSTFTVGTLGSKNGASQFFTIHNADEYVDGMVEIEYDPATKSATGKSATGKPAPITACCHLSFFLSGATYWAQCSTTQHPNDDPTILPATQAMHDQLNLYVTPPTNTPPTGVHSPNQVLDKAMVFLVDKNDNGNLLFRGNSPLAPATVSGGTQSIDFDTLHDYMEARYIQQVPGGTFPAKGAYVLRDVCLQCPTSEESPISQELKSFGGKHMSQLDGQVWFPAAPVTVDGYLGQMCNWSIQPDATGKSPDDIFDYNKAETLSTCMDTPKPTDTSATTLPHVYYIHCASGHDRTGIMASTYFAKNRSLSLLESFIYGTTIAKLPAGETGGGQLHRDCDVINTKTTDPDRSRITLIAGVYNTTVVNVYNKITSSSDTALPAQATQTDPTYVYDSYPWAT